MVRKYKMDYLLFIPSAQSAPAALPPRQAAKIPRNPFQVSSPGRKRTLRRSKRTRKMPPEASPMGRIRRPARFAESNPETNVPGTQQSAVIFCASSGMTPFEIRTASRNAVSSVRIMPITVKTSIAGRMVMMPVFSFKESLVKSKSPRNIFDRIYYRGDRFMSNT